MTKSRRNSKLRTSAEPGVSPWTDDHRTRRKWLVRLAAMIGVMASIMSPTIVNVAVPAIGACF